MDLSSLRSDGLEVFSTTRALREHKKGILSNCALNKSLSLGEFFERAALVPGLKKADSSTCIYYLNKAAKAVKSANSVLHIPDEFFAFLKSSEYIFSFFRELKLAQVDIKSLFDNDIYANFDEHLSILEALKNEYERLLKDAGYYDGVSLDFKINESYIKEFKKIEFYIDGIFSKYELKILKALCGHCEVIIKVKFNKFNKKLLDLIAEFSEIKDLEIGYEYEILANTGQVLSKSEFSAPEPKINLQGFALRSLQCAFVFDEISKMKRAGLKDDEIVVILPDESFSEILANMDDLNMLNYAMGKSIRKTMFFAIIDAINKYLKDEPKWAKNIISSLDKDLLEFFENNFNQKADFEGLEQNFAKILELDNNKELENIVYDELFVLFKLADKLQKTEALSTRQVLELFLENISSKTLSISGGGAVTAMGLLESRGCVPKGVIIVDFNDDIVPKRSKKEMFLSSNIRENAGLTSHNDRENLQKSYYYNLILNATHLSISYTKDDESSALSRFYKELDLPKIKDGLKDIIYANALLSNKNLIIAKKEQNLEHVKHDFFQKELSFSRLSAYLKCPALYYYKYALKIPQKDDLFVNRDYADFGTKIHEILKTYFMQNKNKCDYNALKAMLEKLKFKSGLDNLEFEILKEKLSIFAAWQNEHFKDGWQVLECEKEFNTQKFGVNLTGIIDRIDEKDGELWIFDYKTGSLPKNDLQLDFYRLLTGFEKADFIDLKQKMSIAKLAKNKVDLESVIEKIKDELKANDGYMNLSCNCGGKEHDHYKLLLENE